MEKDRPDISGKHKEKLKEKFQKMAGSVTMEDVARLGKTFEGRFKKIRDKLKDNPRFSKYINQCELIYRLFVSWRRGEYPIPWQMAGAITVALLYVINPFDFIPDFLPIVGYLDDAFIIALCVKLIHGELRNYCSVMGLDKAEYGI